MTQNKRVDKRTMFLFLLLPVLLFGALIFYALGGGKKASAGTAATKGINTELPGAQFKKTEPTDKMDIYNRADRDSVHSGSNAIADVAGRLSFNPDNDPQTKQIQSKLAAIHQQISAPVAPTITGYAPAPQAANQQDMSKDVARLEALMKTMQQNNSGEDPEMKQLNSMMDKILQIQDPELVKQTLKKDVPVVSDSLFKAIPAVIARDQKVSEGAVVELRLMDTITMNGQVIPKGHLIYGLASISNQRLNLEIKNIGLGTAIIPVNLTVFDKTDAMIGINAPEAELSGAVGTGSSNALQSMQFLSMDQSLGVQAAGAGIEAAKGMFSKKIRRIKVKLKTGYPLLLRDNTKKAH
ncbi:conjugative transposon protein TraM [Mucilaginibacter sp. RCC_168]|uniref:conjugative transposon protein TraM n=1 Tax=Mucilaginibacter sp. RCC_168 TaxID=3239221 RepID=UPI0035256F14